MNLTCEKCGGKNTLPKGKTDMFCAFCGTNIEAPVKETKTKVSSSRKGSDKETIRKYILGGSKGKLELPMADLKGIHLKGANLEGANLYGANLENANLNNANLRNANMIDSKLINTDFSGSDLTMANLSEAIFSDEEDDEKNANIDGAILNNVIIKNTKIPLDFSNVKSFKGAVLSGCNLNYACFDDVNLQEVNLQDAQLNGTSMGGTNLMGANLSNIISGNKYKIGNPSYMDQAFFEKANLKRANLKNAQLINAKLSDSDLSGADLTNADLRGANLTNADLRGVNLTNTDLRQAILINANISNLDFSKSNIHETIFEEPKKKMDKSKGCYLSTACIEARNLPDDCHELQVLRKFRDGFVSETLEGRELVKEYYEIAPRIVEAVHDTGYENEILTELYSEIKEIVSMIDRKKNSDAFRHYCEMTQRLKKQYLH